MEKSKAPWRGLVTVLVAAIVGAVLFDAMILADNWAYENLGHEYSLGWFLAMPSFVLGSLIGRDGNLLNPFLVNGALGALLFAILTAYWLAIRRAMRQSRLENK